MLNINKTLIILILCFVLLTSCSNEELKLNNEKNQVKSNNYPTSSFTTDYNYMENKYFYVNENKNVVLKMPSFPNVHRELGDYTIGGQSGDILAVELGYQPVEKINEYDIVSLKLAPNEEAKEKIINWLIEKDPEIIEFDGKKIFYTDFNKAVYWFTDNVFFRVQITKVNGKAKNYDEILVKLYLEEFPYDTELNKEVINRLN